MFRVCCFKFPDNLKLLPAALHRSTSSRPWVTSMGISHRSETGVGCSQRPFSKAPLASHCSSAVSHKQTPLHEIHVTRLKAMREHRRRRCFSLLQGIMSRFRFTQDQRTTVVLELNNGRTVREVSRRHGVSLSTLYRWRSKSTNVRQPTDERERLRSLEDENRRLKRQFAELTLDYATLRAALIRDVRGDC